jgi:hypothetical protein
MPVKRRSNKRLAGISEHEAAWIRGDRNCGFVSFKRDEDLLALWERHGDSETMYWEAGMKYPEPIET